MRRSRRRMGAVEAGRDLVDLCLQGGEGWAEGEEEDLGDTESMKGTASDRSAVRNGFSSSGLADGEGSCERFRPVRRRSGPRVVSEDIVVGDCCRWKLVG